MSLTAAPEAADRAGRYTKSALDELTSGKNGEELRANLASQFGVADEELLEFGMAREEFMTPTEVFTQSLVDAPNILAAEDTVMYEAVVHSWIF